MKKNELTGTTSNVLRTLYHCSQLLRNVDRPVRNVLEEIVSLLPIACQHPEISAARIVLAQMEFVSQNYQPGIHCQQAPFRTRHGLDGLLEVVYTQQGIAELEDPFSAEEQDLIKMVSEMICAYVDARYDLELLRQSEANQRAIINNTNIMVWLVNRQYELISFNKSFHDTIFSKTGVTPQAGMRVSEQLENATAIKKDWIPRYQRALAGGTFKMTVEEGGRVYEFSFNPVIEDGEATGVSVFGEDITERVLLQEEMIAINKRLAETKLMALRAAMNPHFVFNCLNSIQYYIMKNDQLSAITYLSKFSKLIRTTLDNSLLSKGKLVTAIRTIKLYIELESLRFEQKFDLIIEVQPDLDIQSIEIPSLLIQPYIENALMHGLYPKKEKGKLRVAFTLDNSRLLVEVEDNGIGREAAAKMRRRTLTEHKSVGTVLTEERLKLMNESAFTSVEIIDLQKDGSALGTLVKIWIPI